MATPNMVLRRAALCAAWCALTALGQQTPRALLVSGGRVVSMAGPATEGGGVLVGADGKIRAVGADAAKADGAESAERLDFPGATIFPGLIDAACYVGVRRDRDETTTPYEFAVRVLDALDPAHPGFAKHAAAGITTVHLVPGDRNPVAGTTAAVKVSPEGRMRALRESAGLKTSFASESYPGDRAPTSPLGALDALGGIDASLKAGVLTWGEPKTTVFATVRADRDVQLLGAVRKTFGRPVVAMTGVGAGEFAEDNRENAAGYVLEPFGFGLPKAEREKARKLFQGDAPVAFGTYAPLRPATSLRLSAAAAVAAGADPARVERALTLDAARILGVDDRVGSLAKGKDGDLCVFSLPPTDPRSRLLLVVQDGRAVYRAPKE